MEVKSLVRGWLVLTTIMTFGNAIQITDLKLLAAKLFDLTNKNEVSLLYARLFAQWNLFLVVIRLFAVFYPDNKPLCILTVMSFLVSFLYFALEATVFKAATMNLGIISNLAVSGLSLLLFGFFWNVLWSEKSQELEKSTRFSDQLKIRMQTAKKHDNNNMLHSKAE